MTIDQLRWDMLGVHPVFAELEKGGVFFPLMITYAPYTIASMPAIFSGIYGSRTGVNAYFKSMHFDSKSCLLLAQYLQSAGYHTVGDTINALVVPNHGFDRLLIHDENRDDLVSRHQSLLWEVSSHHPFFLYLHYSSIHTEVVNNVIKQYDEFDPRYFGHVKENSERYEGYVFKAGEYMRDLLKTIEDLGIRDRTLLVVITDHGCSLGERPGERAYGVYLYDYTVRTFGYFVWPKVLPAGMMIGSQVRTVDIAPTILDVLRIRPKPGYKAMDGESLFPLIRGWGGDRVAFMETGGLTGPCPSPNEPNLRAVRTREWKFIANTTTGKTELYNLYLDPGETENLAGQRSEMEGQLIQRLNEYIHHGTKG